MLNSKRNDQPSPTPILLWFRKQIVLLTDFFFNGSRLRLKRKELQYYIWYLKSMSDLNLSCASSDLVYVLKKIGWTNLSV